MNDESEDQEEGNEEGDGVEEERKAGRCQTNSNSTNHETQDLNALVEGVPKSDDRLVLGGRTCGLWHQRRSSRQRWRRECLGREQNADDGPVAGVEGYGECQEPDQDRARDIGHQHHGAARVAIRQRAEEGKPESGRHVGDGQHQRGEKCVSPGLVQYVQSKDCSSSLVTDAGEEFEQREWQPTRCCPGWFCNESVGQSPN